MFGKFMNNYYYGKSGKGDYNPEDLPKTRWQLFWEMLRVRLSALCRMNLIYALPFLPVMIVVSMLLVNVVQALNMPTTMAAAYEAVAAGTVGEDGSVTVIVNEETGETMTYTPEIIQQINDFMTLEDTEVAGLQVQYFQEALMECLLWLIPAIFITGPWTAGVSYVTRNWARDEHAFIWSDMKDAMKENWKPALGLSAITSVVPIIVYLCWEFYGSLAVDNWFMVVPQMFTLMVGIMWFLAITYAYPMLVTYQMSFKTIIKNSFLLAVGRLPLSVGIRLLHCVPMVLGVLLLFVTGVIWVPILLFAYYLLIGFTLSRFVTASYTNAQFDKYLNSRIEGAQVNRGLSEADDDDWDEEDDEDDRELKPWENGYTSQDE